MVEENLAELMRRFKEALEQVCEDRPLCASDIQLPIFRPPASPAVTQSIRGYEGGAYDPQTLGVACIVIPSAEFRGANSTGDWGFKPARPLPYPKPLQPSSISMISNRSGPPFPPVRPPAPGSR